MRLLNILFGPKESIAKNTKKDEREILQRWEEYLGTISDKEEVINQLPYSFGQRQIPLKRLKQLLDLELVDVGLVEKDEDELFSDIQSLQHSDRVKRVHRLEMALAYAETKFKYVYELLRHLYSTLKSEWTLLEQISTTDNLKGYRKLVSRLTSEFVVEKTLLGKVGYIKTFNELFSALIRGEHIIEAMDAREKKLLSRMRKIMHSRDMAGSITDKWIKLVFNQIKDKVDESIAQEILDQHPDAEFEFVNGDGFVELVREAIYSLKERKVSEQMINTFVAVFREWFNYLRE